VPAQKADEQIPVWSLRETQALVAWVRASRLVEAGRIGEWVGTCSDKAPHVGTSSDPPDRWWQLLAEAVAEYALETGGAELPAGHFIEWLAEWGREVRRAQRGLLLLTAHRAKGLEFDHVAVLDGAWEPSRGREQEDPDAQRRLYYVAMTRARQSLCLARLDVPGRRHPLLDSLPEGAALLRRAPPILPPPEPDLVRNYVLANQGDVDLGFAGRQPSEAAIHGTLAALKPGDALQLRFHGERWLLAEGAGRIVGRMARDWRPPENRTCVCARVWAILRRHRDQTEEKYLPSVRTDAWEVLLPELVFQPDRVLPEAHKP
jgi:ATP-dependent DNA helicase RecQ